MNEFFINVLGELSDKQVDVIIAVLGLISAFIVAGVGLFGSALTIMLNKGSERKVELRKIKEIQYIEFLSSLAEAKVAKANETYEINKLLSSRIQTIYLVGNENVQNALHKFLEYMTPKKEGTSNTDVNTNTNQGVLYANLIKAMKQDLYGNDETSLSSISFTIFGD